MDLTSLANEDPNDLSALGEALPSTPQARGSSSSAQLGPTYAPDHMQFERESVREARKHGATDDQLAQHMFSNAGGSPDQYQSMLKAGLTPDKVVDYFSPPDLHDKAMGIDASVRNFAHVSTLGLDNYIAAGMDRLTGRNPTNTPKQEQEKSDLAAKEHPMETGVGGVAGGLATGKTLFQGAGLLRSILTGAGTSGAQSVAENVARDKSVGEIAKDAGISTVIGGAMPATFGSATNAAKWLQNKGWLLQSVDTAKQARLTDLVKAAQQPGETFEQAATRLGNQAIRDSDSAVPGVTRTLGQTMPNEPAVAGMQNMVESTHSQAGESVKRVMTQNRDAIVGHVQDITPEADDIAQLVKQRGTEASANYSKAKLFTDIPADKAAAIKQAVDDIQASPYLASAVKTTRDNAVSKGWVKEVPGEEGTAQLSKMYFDDTSGGMRTLDKLKRTLDDAYTVAKKSGENDKAGDINNLRKNLVDALSGASPEYSAAREAYRASSKQIGQQLAARKVGTTALGGEALEGPTTGRPFANAVAKFQRGADIKNEGETFTNAKLAPDVLKKFSTAREEAARIRQQYAIGNGPGSATAGRLSAMTEGPLGTIADVTAADMLAGHHVGGVAIAWKRVVGALNTENQQRAAADIILNPKSTGSSLIGLSKQEQHTVLDAVNNFTNSVQRTATPALIDTGLESLQ